MSEYSLFPSELVSGNLDDITDRFSDTFINAIIRMLDQLQPMYSNDIHNRYQMSIFTGNHWALSASLAESSEL